MVLRLSAGRKQAELMSHMLCIKPEQQNKSFEKELSVKHASQEGILLAAKIPQSFKSDAEREMSKGDILSYIRKDDAKKHPRELMETKQEK